MCSPSSPGVRDAVRLAGQLLMDAGARVDPAAEIAREAGGVPYLVLELVRFTTDARGGDASRRWVRSHRSSA
jgi:hypothetical protein